MRIMIVDDEVIIRNGLSTVINWEELGFTLLPPAASGEEALARLPEEQPNIVLTDIQMTGMDGIELATAIRGRWPDTEVIILTGYDTFTYAQKAIREGVSDYLLKSSRPEEIIMAAMKAKQRLQERWESKRQESRGRSALRDRLLERLASEGSLGGQSPETVQELLPRLKLDEPGLQALLLAASGWGERSGDVRLAQFAVANMVQELVPCEALHRKDHVLLVLNRRPDGDDRLELELVRISRKLKCKLFVAAGSVAGRLEELPRSYAEAERAFEYRWIAKEDAFIPYETICGRSGGRTVVSEEEEARFIAIAKAGSLLELRQWIDELLTAQLSDPEVTPDSLLAYLHSIIATSRRWLERVSRTLGEPAEPAASAVAEPSRPELPDRSDNPYDSLFLPLKAAMDRYKELTAGERVSYMKRAIAYISDHLDRNLTQQQVARHVHLHPNHFSEVFKRETGLTYTEFVTKARMNRAMELLNETPAKVSDIASRVGYEDVKYFGQLFKKATGLTPSEYRNRT